MPPLSWPFARPLALLVSAAAAIAAAAAAAGAQGGPAWNDARTMEIVRAAIARRAVQLADTGLVDYTARAHGYVTFLAQVGEGFPDPPALIKADELAVEVYWGAPDRSKQHVIGRRDTLLLPTDIAYHRDHLGVVQNNFPAIIRLGDGDEVRDVPHPLSDAGLATYDFRVVDSLAIRAGAQAIDVMMVSLRPRDDRASAAVGAVYIDRITASVVRMSLSFTRAALKDPQLEDVSVILENGLVDGRFWLPRRQEIEIRRRATWMDFPARGIIRGRWEICCVSVNVGLAPATFRGPEITHAPREQQRAHDFPGTVLGTLPEEMRALDAPDVRRVQEEARALVRAAALARPRPLALGAARVSDVVRVNRAEGFAVGAGLTRGLGAGFDLRLLGRYGTADERAKGRGELGWTHGSGTRVALDLQDEVAFAGLVPEGSGLRNSIAAQEFGSDWSDPYGVRGGRLRLERPRVAGGRLMVEAAVEEHRPLAVTATPATGRYAAAFPATEARVERFALGWSGSIGGGGPGTGRGALSLRVEAGRADPPGSGAASGVARGFLHASLDVSGSAAAGPGVLAWRTIAGATSGAGAGVPAQYLVRFGGPVTAPGLPFHSLAGSAGFSQRVEYQLRIPFASLNLGRFGRVPSSLIVAPYVHGAWVERGGGAGWETAPAAGVGVLSLFDLLRVDVARPLRGRGWLLSVDVARQFWSVL